MLEQTGTGALSIVSTLGIDVAVLAVAVVVLTLWGLTKGKRVLLALLLALYPALLIATTFPWYSKVTFLDAVLTPLALFGAVTLGLFLVLRSYICSSFPANSIWRFLEVGVLAVGITGFTLAAVHSTLGLSELYDLSAPLQTIFAGSLQTFLWYAVPLVAIPLSVRA